MKTWVQRIPFYPWPLVFVLLSVTSFAAPNDTVSEFQKIDALLETVKSSDVTFIRNGSEYTATEAYDHLRRKLKSAQNSWFAPPKEKWTARMFIDKIAAGSSLSGKPYLIRFPDGKVLKSREWLSGLLDEIEAKKAPVKSPKSS